MKVLFWNTHRQKNDLLNLAICDIILENDINIAAFAEYENNLEELLILLQSNGVFMTKYITIGCEKVIIIGNVENVKPGLQSNRFSIQIINDKYILCAAHFPSRLHDGHKERREIAVQMAINGIQETERKLGCEQSIIVGDINEDPYENSCLSARNLHGLPSAQDAKRGSRTVEGKLFYTFYNPMWNMFGDFSSPPGTFYYSASMATNSFWHIYDQVILRPCLIDSFVEGSFCIPTETKNCSLLDENGHPDKRTLSDHLPVIFEIKEDPS